MKIAIGTKNNAKVEAIREVILDYPMFNDFEIFSFDVLTGVNDQPLTLDETIIGAKNRARESYSKLEGCDYSIGIESGFMVVKESNTGMMEVTVCVVYDGKKFELGLSPCFEIPDEIHKLLLEGHDLTQAANIAGYCNDSNIGMKEGVIGILTKGRVTRKDYTKDSIKMALIRVEGK